jgi:hypothetical protein
MDENPLCRAFPSRRCRPRRQPRTRRLRPSRRPSATRRATRGSPRSGWQTLGSAPASGARPARGPRDLRGSGGRTRKALLPRVDPARESRRCQTTATASATHKRGGAKVGCAPHHAAQPETAPPCARGHASLHEVGRQRAGHAERLVLWQTQVLRLVDHREDLARRVVSCRVGACRVVARRRPAHATKAARAAHAAAADAAETGRPAQRTVQRRRPAAQVEPGADASHHTAAAEAWHATQAAPGSDAGPGAKAVALPHAKGGVVACSRGGEVQGRRPGG